MLLPPDFYLLLLSPGLLGWTAGFPAWFLEAGGCGDLLDDPDLPVLAYGARPPLLAPLLAPFVCLLQWDEAGEQSQGQRQGRKGVCLID